MNLMIPTYFSNSSFQKTIPYFTTENKLFFCIAQSVGLLEAMQYLESHVRYLIDLAPLLCYYISVLSSVAQSIFLITCNYQTRPHCLIKRSNAQRQHPAIQSVSIHTYTDTKHQEG